MIITNLADFYEAPPADLFLCINPPTGWSMATLQKADVEHFFKHAGATDYVVLYSKVKPPVAAPVPSIIFIGRSRNDQQS